MSKRIELTDSQAQALAEIHRRKVRAEKEWATAIALAGIEGEIVSGNLDDDPHLMVEDDPSTA